MTRPRRQRARAPEVSDTLWCILTDQPLPPRLTEKDGWDRYLGIYDRRERGLNATPRIETLWQQYGEAILTDWAVDHPGTRPTTWWEFGAPRSPRWPDVAIPRQQVGGSGVPRHDAFPERHRSPYDFMFGLPRDWHVEPDAAAPALFESQAAYLLRQDLLLAGEKRLLRSVDLDPEAWEPQPILSVFFGY